MTEVLRKVHKSLRSSGYLLITQPAPVDAVIELEIDGKIVQSEAFHEVKFREYLECTGNALQGTLAERLFVVELEEITPKEGFHSSEYRSVDEWVADYTDLCDDLEELNELAAKLREAARGRDHRIIDKWRESWLLLRKTLPGSFNG